MNKWWKDNQPTEIHKQLRDLINETMKRAEHTSGSVERIKGCTLIEEWRHACGYSFDDGDLDNDLGKAVYDYFEEHSLPSDREQFFGYVQRVGISLEKYPLLEGYK